MSPTGLLERRKPKRCQRVFASKAETACFRRSVAPTVVIFDDHIVFALLRNRWQRQIDLLFGDATPPAGFAHHRCARLTCFKLILAMTNASHVQAIPEQRFG